MMKCIIFGSFELFCVMTLKENQTEAVLMARKEALSASKG
jgi:hypothetical protein